MPVSRKILLSNTSYMGWAGQQVLEMCAQLTDEQRQRDLGASHGSLLKTILHMYFSERVWLRRLTTDALPPLEEIGSPQNFEDISPDPSFADLQQKWPVVWREYSRWLDAMDDESLSHELSASMASGGEFRFTRWELVVHAVNHSTLHRGQVIGMLRALGIQPVNLDIFSYYCVRRSGELIEPKA